LWASPLGGAARFLTYASGDIIFLRHMVIPEIAINVVD